MSNNLALSLVDDPWIPVILSGNKNKLSLRNLFKLKNEVTIIDVRPAEWVSLMRLFLCIYDRCYDLLGHDKFIKLLKDNIEAEEYLKNHREAFELFNNCPGKLSKGKRFLQVENLELTGGTEVFKLDLYTPCGNTPILLNHTARSKKLNKEEIALSLLTKQCFGEWGLTAQTRWNNRQTAKAAKGSPCVAGTPMHYFLEGNTLGETLRLNSALRSKVHLPYELGIPVWEDMPAGITDKNTDTYFGRLVPISKAIWLKDLDNMTYAAGLEYTNLGRKTPHGKYEPHHCRVTKTDKKINWEETYRIRTPQLAWQELEIILQSGRHSGHSISGASIADNIPVDTDVNIVLTGLITDGTNWSVLETPFLRMRLPAGIAQAASFSTFKTTTQKFKNLATNLRAAVYGYHKAFKSESAGDIASKAEEAFYLCAATPDRTNQLLEAAVNGTVEQWLRKSGDIQKSTYLRFCPANTKKQLIQSLKGQKKLQEYL